jgi:hypothetical protein
MAKTNHIATAPTTQDPTEQPPKKAFTPSKKPRTALASARAAKGDVAPARTPRRARRADKSGEPSHHDLATTNEGGKPSRHDLATTTDKSGEPAHGGLATAGEGEIALARVQHEIEALHRDQVRRINVHVPTAALVALGALPKLLALRDEIRARLPDHPIEALDKLRDYALAAAYAHALALPRDEGETNLRALVSEATPLRERLLSGAEALAKFGLLDAKRVAAIRRGTGHLDTAQDLTALGALFRNAWPAVASKTPVARADVERAVRLGAILLEALGQRRQGTDGSDDPREAEERLAKAYELFFRAYDACRHAVHYLRWHQGDADEIAPSLLQSRRRSRRTAPDDPDVNAPPGDEPGDGEADAGGGQ